MMVWPANSPLVLGYKISWNDTIITWKVIVIYLPKKLHGCRYSENCSAFPVPAAMLAETEIRKSTGGAFSSFRKTISFKK